MHRGFIITTADSLRTRSAGFGDISIDVKFSAVCSSSNHATSFCTGKGAKGPITKTS